MTSTNSVQYTIKRDGITRQGFDSAKLKKAIGLAWLDAKGEVDDRLVNDVVKMVTASLVGEIVDVETVQDAVETSLMRYGQFSVAKSYILYRHKRQEYRSLRSKATDPKGLSDYIHAGKYARYLPAMKRRECYEETVSRVESMHVDKFPEIAEEIKEAFNLVRDKKVLPSMRSMQFGGAAIEANNNRIFNCSFSLVDRWEAFSEALFLLLSGCGVGYSVQFDHVEKLPVVGRIDPKEVLHHVIEDSIEGWAEALKALLLSFQTGVNIEFSYHEIRHAGIPLKTSGGKAPGHLQLKTSLERIRNLLLAAQGRKLRPIECHRIMCHAADAVLSGGIRRSAMISLFSFEDSEMVYAKTGNWWNTDPWFQNANNSVILKRDEVKKKQFKRIFQMTRQWGEPGFYFTDNYDHGTNPCFHPDTRLWTSQGYIKIKDLFKEGTENLVLRDLRVGKGDLLNQNSGVQESKATAVFLTQKNAPVFKLITEHGHEVTTTETHEFPTIKGRKQLRDLKPGDTLLLPSGEGSFGEGRTFEEGLLLGLYVGDGTSETDASYIDLWEDDFDQKDQVLAALNKVVESEPTYGYRPYGEIQWQNQRVPDGSSDKVRAGGTRFLRWLTSLSDNEQLPSLKQRVPEAVWRGSREFVVGYLQGLFAADGTVLLGGHGTKATLSLRLGQSNKELLGDIQQLLSMFGVVSRIYSRRPAGYRMMPDNKGFGQMAPYYCKEHFELVVNRPNSIEFCQKIGLFGRKAQIMRDRMSKRGVSIRKPERFITRVLSIEPAGTTDVYCLTQPETNSVVANGVVTGQCCEIGLDPILKVTAEIQEKLLDRGVKAELDSSLTGWAFCNLCEMNAAKFDSYSDFEKAAKAAALIGTLQASYTKMPYLGAISEVLAERDALLGIGMTGMLDSPDISCNPKYQKSIAIKVKEWNAEYAAKLGINPAARTTCVKPSGCRPWDALTTTDKGILTLEEMFWHHPTGETWSNQPEGLSVIQDMGSKSPITKTFDNGEAEVLEIEMNYGLVVRSTANHPWFVQYNHSRTETSVVRTIKDWVPAHKISPGDVLDVSGLYRNERSWKFTPINVRALTMRSSAKVIKQPEEMDDDIAWLLGYTWGDGCQSLSKYRLRFTDGNRAVIAKAQRVLAEKFSLETNIRELSDRNAASLEVGSSHLWLWMVRNGVEKYFEEGSLNRIPRCIRSSSWRHLVAFIAGLLDSDGCLNHTKTGCRPQISSSADDFARHLQQVAWAVGLGFGRSLQSQGESFQKERHLYHLSLSASPTKKDAFSHFVSQSVKCQSFSKSDSFTKWQMDNDTTRGRQIPGKVRTVRSLGIMPTFDIEVANTHWFYDGVVKSHNTTSLELGCVAAGHHAHHARRYIRRVTADEMEPLFQEFKKVNPHMCVRKPDGKWVIEFPIQAPDGAIVRNELTAIKFLEMVKSTQQNWVIPGNSENGTSPGLSHNVSNTVTVKPDEWDSVCEYLWKNRNYFTGVSLLASSGDKDYAFAPNEEITTPADEKRWNDILLKYKPLDYTALVEESDETDLTAEVACAGGVCLI